MLEFLTLKPETFGLDISEISLKIIKLKKKKEHFELASFGEAEIKPGIIEGGEIKNQKALAKIIKKALARVKGEKLKTKYVIASLPEEKAFLQVVQMPIISEQELKSAVIYEAERHIPLPIEQVYLDSQIVPPIVNRLDHLDVLVVAIPKKTVDLYTSSLKEAGLIPQVLEVESQSIARVLVKDGVSPTPIILIDLGATRTSFIIFSGHSLRFTTSIPVSSQKFTEAISRTLKVDFKKAEQLKFKYGIKNDIKRRRSKIFEALIPILTDLIEQIKKCITFYQTHATHEHLPPDGKGIEKIFLCGGGANLKGLPDFLSSELKLPVELGNPWINILPKPLKEIPPLSYKESLKYTTALGLALRGFKEK